MAPAPPVMGVGEGLCVGEGVGLIVGVGVTRCLFDGFKIAI